MTAPLVDVAAALDCAYCGASAGDSCREWAEPAGLGSAELGTVEVEPHRDRIECARAALAALAVSLNNDEALKQAIHSAVWDSPIAGIPDAALATISAWMTGDTP